jgi:hypothetical protein
MRSFHATLAADLGRYDIGTVIYIPSFKGKICPQNGEPVDGCFIVGDKGKDIKGNGRFDIFTGECSRYDGKEHVCRDPENAAFNVPDKTEFRIVPKKTELAGALRREVDEFIDNGWKPVQYDDMDRSATGYSPRLNRVRWGEP